MDEQSKPRGTNSCLVVLLAAILIGGGLIALLPFGAGQTEDARPAVVPTTFRATAYCPDCAEEGMEINVWDSIDRDRVVGTVPHGEAITVFDSARHNGEGRTYYHVRYGSVVGWLPLEFVMR